MACCPITVIMFVRQRCVRIPPDSPHPTTEAWLQQLFNLVWWYFDDGHPGCFSELSIYSRSIKAKFTRSFSGNLYVCIVYINPLKIEIANKPKKHLTPFLNLFDIHLEGYDCCLPGDDAKPLGPEP